MICRNLWIFIFSKEFLKCSSFMHVYTLSEFALGHIVIKVMIGFPQPRYQIKPQEFLLLWSYSNWLYLYYFFRYSKSSWKIIIWKRAYFLSIRTWFHTFTTFFQTARISAFFKIWYSMHGWNMILWKYTVDEMDGSDFRGKTVGPVYFETDCTFVLWRICV